MDTLFADFAALEKSLELGLIPALEGVKNSYVYLFEASVKRTIATWTLNFSQKCPKTLARFIEEFQADSKDFVKRTLPNFLGDAVGTASSQEDLMKSFRQLKKDDRSATTDELLDIIAGDRDDESVEVGTHVEAKHNLKDLYLTVQKNTSVLEALANDDDDANAIYVKIVQME